MTWITTGATAVTSPPEDLDQGKTGRDRFHLDFEGRVKMQNQFDLQPLFEPEHHPQSVRV